jgi:hypothetical protein
MENRELMRIEDARGTVVHVREGAVWVTQERDPRDYYIPARASFTVTRDGLTVISALGHASIELGSLRPRGWSSALARMWIDLFAPQARVTTAGL